jgi:hypothetical protein
MDPYARLEIGNELYQTNVHNEGGKNPEWNHEFLVNLDHLD